MKLKSSLTVLSILFALGCFACFIQTTPSHQGGLSEPRGVHATETSEQSTWRRTLHGWQRISDWTDPSKPASIYPNIDFGAIHPALVGLMQLLLSVGALAFFSSSASK